MSDAKILHPEPNPITDFKAGDKVSFKGLTVGTIVLQPREGVLRKADDNTAIKGVVSIVGDKQQLLFNSNGSMYCHGHHGILLERLES